MNDTAVDSIFIHAKEIVMLLNSTLSNTDIEEAIRLLKQETKKTKMSGKIQTSFSLAVEELLLTYRDRMGEQTSLSIQTRRTGSHLNLEISIDGEEYDPFLDEDSLLQALLDPVDEVPHWQYANGKNIIQFQFVTYHTTMKSIRFSWHYIRQHRRLLFLAVACQLVGGLFAITAPIVSARIIQTYVQGKGWQVIYIAALLMVISLLHNLFVVMSNQTYNHVYTRTLSALEGDLVENMLRIENSCIDMKGSGLFIQRLTTDTERIASGFNTLADMITQIINYLGILIAMCIVDVRFCLIVIFLLILQTLLELWRMRRLQVDDRVFRRAKERYSGLVGEMVRGQKDVKFLNSEQQFTKELDKRINNANEKRLYMQSRSWNVKLLRFEIGEVGAFGLIILLGYLITQKSLMPANALVLFNYYSSLGPNFIRFAGSMMDFLEDFNLSNERVSSLLTSKEFPKEEFGTTQMKDMKGEVAFDHVCFSYARYSLGLPGKNVLDDLCLRIRAGESVALVGKSGCGKTTIFNLIDKLYVAKEGKVLLDGVDIRDLTKESIRGNITVVSQTPYIFHMSVKDNLLLSKPDATDDELHEVCRLACIDEDVQKMPEGYDTILGEGGVNISGGQRQRLSIARALLRNSRIILFDEATSALDNVTQAKIQTAIDNMQKDRTVILIAHRLSTVLNSDRILYMQDGKIIAEGTHEELLETCEPYRKLASMEGKAS